jgi:hypothetical protein
MTEDKKIKFGCGTLITLADTTLSQIGPSRVANSPTAWRLARRNGELILQAGSIWTQGREFGIEWNDLPTVDLDELEALSND